MKEVINKMWKYTLKKFSADRNGAEVIFVFEQNRLIKDLRGNERTRSVTFLSAEYPPP